MKILLIDNYDSFTYNLFHYLSSLKCKVDVFRNDKIGIDKIKSLVKVPLDGMKIAPFYGCYIVRPSKVLGFDDHPDRQQALEELISAVGAEVVDFPGKTLCCGFPITTINETASMKMVARHTTDAQQLGADAMVTPCPLCHLNLDGFQPKAAQMNAVEINMPILHLPQMIGLELVQGFIKGIL